MDLGLISPLIKSLCSCEGQDCDGAVKNIRQLVGSGSQKKLEDGIGKATTCQKGITTFHQQTRQHLAEIKRRRIRQEHEGMLQEGTIITSCSSVVLQHFALESRAELSPHVQFIKDKVEERVNVCKHYSMTLEGRRAHLRGNRSTGPSTLLNQ